MSTGKIVYTPAATKAVTLDGASYLQLADDPVFDAGTGDFNVSLIFYVDPGISTANYYKLLAGKGNFDLASAAGWHVGYNPYSDKIKLTVNDGNASALESAAALAVSKGYWYWLHLNVTRSGNAVLYLYRFSTGALVGTESLDVSSRSGSWSNAVAFRLGNWGATANRYFQGYLGYLRVDLGRAVNATWISRQWDWVRYGAPRVHAPDLTETWQFGDSLAGDSDSAYTLTYEGGTAAYVSGPPSGTLTYTLGKPWTYDSQPGYLDTGAVERAIDGTARSYSLPVNKNFRTLPFIYLPWSQVAAFWGIWASKQEFIFYDDADNPADFRGLLIQPPEIRPKMAFFGGVHLWDATLEVQET